MGHIVDVLPPGQTALGLAQKLFGEESGRILSIWGSETPVVCVVDTNILLNDLKYSLLVQPLTALMEAVCMGTVNLFASTTVRDEVWEKLGVEKITRKLKIDPIEARQRWEQSYLPWITFLDPIGLPPLSGRVKDLLQRDPDDVPTGQLIELLQPDVVFCFDKDLDPFDVLADGWTLAAVAYRDISRRDGVMAGVAVTSSLAIKGTLATTSLSFAAVEQARSGLERIDKKVLWCLVLVIGVAAVCALAYAPSRRWLSEQGKALASAVKHGASFLGERVSEAAEMVATVEQVAQDARVVLTDQGQRALTPPRGLREYAARALARSRGPLSLSELMERIEEAGYQAHAKQPKRSLSQMLHAHFRLFCMEEGRWSLRSHPFPNR